MDRETSETTRLHGLRYTIVDGRIYDARAMLEDVTAIADEAKSGETPGGGP